MVPGVLDENVARDTAFTVVRFTATDIGTYAVTGKFENIWNQPGADPVYILANADSLTQIFSGVLPSTPCPPRARLPFTFTMFLDVGRTLDFVASHSAVGNAASVGLAADRRCRPRAHRNRRQLRFSHRGYSAWFRS